MSRTLTMLSIWLLAAALFVGAGALRAVPAVVVPVMAGGLTLGVLGAWWVLPGFGAWMARLDIRALVLLHVTRFVGIWFLVLESQGRLPHTWAVGAGWGDIAVATLALGLGLLAHRLGTAREPMLILWNVLGLADLLLVVASAARIVVRTPYAMLPLRELPLGLLPTFLVPLLIASHVIMLSRLTGRRSPAAS